MTSINRAVYLNIKKKKLFTYTNINRFTHVQHDEASCHQTKEDEKWINSNSFKSLHLGMEINQIFTPSRNVELF